MAFMDQLKLQFSNLKARLNKIVEQINAWPQYMKIGVAIILLGFILLIIGILLY